MKKLLCAVGACLLVGACVGKQSVDSRYYRNTSWAKGSESLTFADDSAVKKKAPATNRVVKNQTTYSETAGNETVPSSRSAGVGDKWQDPQAIQQVAVPAMPEKKIQCTKKGDAYTCRYGQTICGTGCRADGSNCYHGYCLKSECDDVMGQKWDWVKAKLFRSDSNYYYACKHPNYDVACMPGGIDGIVCTNDDIMSIRGQSCGYQCNKNGTDCGEGKNNCWDKYR